MNTRKRQTKTTTVLRVKRRRDEPAPPLTLKLQPLSPKEALSASSNAIGDRKKKRSRRRDHNDDDAMLSAKLQNLMHSSTFLSKRADQIRSFDYINDNDTNHHNDDDDDDGTEDGTNKATAVIFRRVTSPDDVRKASIGSAASSSSSSSTTSSNTNMNMTMDSHRNGTDASTGNRITKKETAKRKAGDANSVVRVVDARLDNDTDVTANVSVHADNPNAHNLSNMTNTEITEMEHRKKRTRISLQMVNARTMTRSEFWDRHTRSSKSVISTPVTSSTHVSTKSLLRQRMKRNATATNNSSFNVNNIHKRNIILDPITRMVDQSLLSLTANITTNANVNANAHTINHNDSVNASDNSILQHIQLLQNNTSSTSSAVSKSSTTYQKYLNWQSTTGSGTILHTCALLNSVRGAQILCADPAIDFEVLDGEGRTALDVALLVASSGVASVIRSFSCIAGTGEGGNVIVRDAGTEEREEDYVYDLYCLQQDDDDNGDDGNGGDYGSCNDTNIMDTYTKETRDEECNKNGTMTNGTAAKTCSHDENNVQIGDPLSVTATAADNSDNGTKGDGVDRDESTMQVRDVPSPDKKVVTASTSTLTSSNISSTCTNNQSEHIGLAAEVEIRGGIGYWNQYGELVLETQGAICDGMFASDDDDDDDDDQDSNEEGFEGNDYPEEEDMPDDDDDDDDDANDRYYDSYNIHGGNGTYMRAAMFPSSGRISAKESRYYNGKYSDSDLDSDDDDDDDGYGYDRQFRNRAVDLGQGNTDTSMRNVGDYDVYRTINNGYGNINDGGDDGEYRGYMYGESSHWSNESSFGGNEYAYDLDDLDNDEDVY